MTKKLRSSPVDKAIERILELSADAQIRRREIAKDSLAHYTVTETIAAYGKALALLTALQRVVARLILWFAHGLLVLCFIRMLFTNRRFGRGSLAFQCQGKDISPGVRSFHFASTSLHQS